MAKRSNLMEVQSGDVTGKKLLTTDFGGRVRLAHGSVEIGVFSPKGYAIELVRLPKGARLLPISEVYFEKTTDTDTHITIGDSGDSKRYLGDTKLESNKIYRLDANKLNDYVLPEEDVIKATTQEIESKANRMVFDIFFVTD